MSTDQERAAHEALAAVPVEPLFLLHCGRINSDGEQDEWECEADSNRMVDAFARLHPNQTIALYPAPQPQQAAATQEQKP